MTTLHKLSIRGVRSYSPDTESVIKFQHPLTIIVGANGSGKTSIIECLKYICSGEFPPLSDKGKSFVHDPDSCGEPIVKGQIKLAFKATADKNVIAIKSFQVTAQKGRRTFKLIDSVLSTTDEQGQQKTVSYKCARMDDLMTQLMGVTTPILENVIFCHQLDADWPLSDDKSLKKRFDDIFAATKYTRALESIKKIRNEQLSKCKDLQRDLDIIANNLETVQKIEADKARTRQSLEMLTEKWEVAQRQKELHSRSFNELSAELSAIEEYENNLMVLERELQTMEQEVVQARNRLQTEYSESTSELVQRLSQFSEELDKRKSKLAGLEKEFNRAVRLEEEISTRYQNSVKAAGKIEFLEQQHTVKLSESGELITRLPDEVRLSYSPRELQDSGDISPVLTKLSDYVTAKQRHILKRKDEHKDSLASMDKQVSSLKQQLQDYTQTEQLEKRQMELFSNHISNLDIDLTVTKRKLERLLPLKHQAEQAQRELDSHLKAIGSERLELKMEQYNRQLQECNNELFAANKTLTELQSSNEARNRVAVQEKLYHQAKTKFEQMKDSSFVIIPDVLRHSYSTDTKSCLQQLTAALNSKLSETESIKRADRKKQDELLLLTNRRKSLAQQLQTADSEVSALRQQIADANVESLKQAEEFLHERKLERDRLDSIIRNATEYANLFADWGAEAEKAIAASKPHSCGLCERSFSFSELQSFIARNAERVRSLRSPEELQSNRRQLQQVERRISKLEQVRNIFQKIDSLKKQTSSARSSLEEVDNNVQALEADIRQFSMKLQNLDRALTEHRQAQSQVESLLNAENEMLRLEADLKQLESSCKTFPTGTIEEMQRQHSTLQSRSQQLSYQINEIRQQMLRNDEMTRALREKSQHLREEAGALTRVETKIEEVNQSIADYHERRKQSEIAITRSREASMPIQTQLHSLLSSKEKYESEATSESRSLEQSLLAIQSQQRQLQTLNQEFQQIAKELQSLRVNQESIARLNSEAQNARSAVRDLQLELQKQRKAIAECESDHRSLQDNIEYRQRLEKYEKQAGLLEQLHGDVSRKYRAREVVSREFEKTQKMLMECERISASSQGERSALLNQLQSFESTLAEDRYRNIAIKHRHATIDLESTKMMLADLDQYYRALDKSLMDFHSIKMSEINQVLKELWQCTYRGNDIDAIAIRSDHAEGAADLGAARQKKQYSYRLVMMQGDIELDMRGRSSAGQRVLASLLIRLALSETFCVRCGILALDEPTQNLDEANIRALADALNALIERRKGHENFQLILITHDEEFVELLRKRDNADCYWRVFKDANNCSRIKRIPINC